MNVLHPAAIRPEPVDERYTVRDAREIVRILRALEDARELVTLHFGSHGAFTLSVVLDVDVQRRRVVLDAARDDEVNAEMLASPRLVVAAQLAHVRVQFESNRIAAVEHDGSKAFALPLPTAVIRLQRRDAYRVRLPATYAVRCELPGAAADAAMPVLLDARVVDISCTGLRLADLPLALPWQPGAFHGACRLPLPQVGVVMVDFRVVRLSHAPSPRDARGPHVGVQFVGLHESASMRIARFVTEAQRNQRVRELKEQS